jgi:hypothetical protein
MASYGAPESRDLALTEKKFSKEVAFLQYRKGNRSYRQAGFVASPRSFALFLFLVVCITLSSAWTAFDFDFDFAPLGGRFGYHVAQRTSEQKAQTLLRKHPLIGQLPLNFFEQE